MIDDSKGNVQVLYQGNSDDYVVFATSKDDLEKYRKDSTVPLVEVTALYKVFATHRHGSQGVLDEAPKGQLQSDFGTTNVDDVVAKILREGESQPVNPKFVNAGRDLRR
uniref:ARAD1A08404p n=1 Tax=Blastobotrys adeninivorans TaxID=409370 RepID=A0A060SXD0_BLAAD